MSKKQVILASITLCLIAAFSAGCGGSAEKAAPPPKNATAEKVTVEKIPAAKIFDLSKTKDGTYTGKSSMNVTLGHDELTITIKNHKIVAAKYIGKDLQGDIKGEDYGKVMGKIVNEGMYRKAQNCVKALGEYADQLVEVQLPSKVDAISGATVSYKQLAEAFADAVKKAER